MRRVHCTQKSLFSEWAVGRRQEAGLRSEPVWGLEWTPLTLEAMQWERLLHLRFPLFILPQTELYHTSLERVKWHFSF